MAALVLQHQKAVRQAKKSKADAFLAEVDAAIQAGDQFVAYKVLKKLRPWQPSQKAQLKDSKGYLLSPRVNFKNFANMRLTSLASTRGCRKI